MKKNIIKNNINTGFQSRDPKADNYVKPEVLKKWREVGEKELKETKKRFEKYRKESEEELEMIIKPALNGVLLVIALTIVCGVLFYYAFLV